jgi:hypothetical protein
MRRSGTGADRQGIGSPAHEPCDLPRLQYLDFWIAGRLTGAKRPGDRTAGSRDESLIPERHRA